MSDDAIQDLLHEIAFGLPASHPLQPRPIFHRETLERAQAQHTANRNVIASLRSSLEGRAVEVANLTAERNRLRWGVVGFDPDEQVGQDALDGDGS